MVEIKCKICGEEYVAGGYVEICYECFLKEHGLDEE